MRPPIQGTETWVDLLRHGEPVGGRRYRGAQDDPLSELGWEQMHRAGVNAELLTAIVTSPLIRCRAFAQQLSVERQIPLEVEAGFREIGFGDWEGRSPAELAANDPEAQARFWADPIAYPPPNAEPMEAFQQRVVTAWEAVTTRHRGAHLLVVGHGGLIRVILSHLLGLPLQGFNRLYVPYASLTRVRVEPGLEPTLYFHNRASAAEGER